MAIEAVEREISGTRYTTTKIPAMRAAKLQNRLARVLGPGLAKVVGALLAGIGGGTRLEDLDFERIDFVAVGGAVGEVFSNLDDATTEGLIRDLLSSTSYLDEKGNPRPLFPSTSNTVAFDEHFTGDLSRMWQVVGFSLGVNFGGFFDVVSGLIRRGQAAREAAESARSASTSKPIGS